MPTLQSTKAFEEYSQQLSLEGPKIPLISISAGTCSLARGAREVIESFKKEIQTHQDRISLKITGCHGYCEAEPNIIIFPEEIFYQHVKPNDATRIIEATLTGQVVNDLVCQEDGQEFPRLADIPFYKNQMRILLGGNPRIDPTAIDDYIFFGGYQALIKVLNMRPEEVIAEITRSGLRGRGGAGFPTGKKWEIARQQSSDIKYIICNADEGDPGAYMDRSLLEGNPHSVLEGMIAGAYAIGATEGWIYVRDEYPLAVTHVTKAVEQAYKLGLLGQNILQSAWSFDIHVIRGAGSFVCGEETALMHSIENKRGIPRQRPPFPAQKGLWGKPTNINNVETWANVPHIINKGADWFSGIGTDTCKGTKIFSLVGKVKNTGLIEVPMGISLKAIVYEIGGGSPSGKSIKAIQTGGPSGGCIPAKLFDLAVDYESLKEVGSIMGSGGMIVMDEDTCMVDIARYYTDFLQAESCGKCAPCREGTQQMFHILTDITQGKANGNCLALLQELGDTMRATALCALGATAPNPILSTIRYFRHEYAAHIIAKYCEAGVCSELVRAPCQNACPAHVDVPGYVSLTGEKRYTEALRLHRNRNPFASICARVCIRFCESSCSRATIDESVSIKGIKRFMVEQEKEIQVPETRENAENAKRKIAIVGAGPAGLSCAYFLARLGYKLKIFEAESRPGGMLVQTIPSYRLPRKELEKEIQMILDLGVTLETGKKLGRDFTLAGLKDDGYEAIFLGVGSPNGTVVKVQGFETEGVTDAITFLREYNLKGSVNVGKKVVVVGGGYSAIDVARTAIRLGAEVTIVYRRTRYEMPADREEIEAALAEGVLLKTLTNPAEILASNGKMSGVRCHIMTLGGFDLSGRRAPQPTDETVVLEADQLIFAVGQSLDCAQLLGDVQVETRWSTQIKADEFSGQTSVPWVFAGGDTATGPASVVQAVAGGERAAVGIDEYLTGENHAFWREDQPLDTTFDPEADPTPDPRIAIPYLPVAARKNNFAEVELTWSETEAMIQCKRCIRCEYGKENPDNPNRSD